MSRLVFLSYVREDSPLVDRLAADLRAAGIEVWLDRDNIAAGERWRDAIRGGIRRGDLFIACFSSNYAQRDQTYMNEELILAIEQLRMRPTDRSWFIPVSLDGAAIPERTVGAGETLRDLQAVDLSTAWRSGIQRIIAVARPEARSARNASATSFRSESTTEKALRLDRAHRMAKEATDFAWTAAGVSAAILEVENLYVTLLTRATELSMLTSSLQVEADKSYPSCVIRLGDRSVLVCWRQPYANEVEDAKLSILEYPFRYHFAFPARVHAYAVVKEYRFGTRDGMPGWSSGGEFVTSNDIAETCFDLLLSRTQVNR
jgi:hypothetical protein